MDGELFSGRREHGRRRTNGEVVRCRPDVGAFDLDGDATPRATLRPQLVRQVHQAEQRLQSMESVGLPSEHPEEQVELRMGPQSNRGIGHGLGVPRRSLSATGVRARDQAPARTTGKKVEPWYAMA